MRREPTHIAQAWRCLVPLARGRRREVLTAEDALAEREPRGTGSVVGQRSARALLIMRSQRGRGTRRQTARVEGVPHRVVQQEVEELTHDHLDAVGARLAAADGMALERVRGLEGVYVAQVGGEHFHSTRQARACRPRRRRPRHRRCW